MGSAKVDSTSSCIVSPLHWYVVLRTPEPGLYFVNLVVSEKLVGTALLAAETDKPRYSYSLPSEETQRVRSGEVMVLTKRSRPASETRRE